MATLSAVSPKLRLVFFESTSGCNLRCAHCRRIDTTDEARKHDLNTRDALALMNAVRGCGQPIFVLSGGEPLTRPDCFTLIHHAKEIGLPLALATNGTLVDRGMAVRIAEAGVQRVSISIDGADAATHDGLRGVAGSFDAACAALGHLRAAGVSTQMNVTITARTNPQRDAIYELALRLNVDALHCFILVPVGCGATLDPGLRLSPGAQEQFLLWLHERACKGRLFVKATCAPQYHRILQQAAQRSGVQPTLHQHGLSATTKGCLAGSGVCFIDHKGEVFPCGYLPLSAGSIHQQPFADIWSDSLLFASLRDPNLLNGRCGACEYNQHCGGCRARAYADTGDVFDEDRSCPYQPK